MSSELRILLERKKVLPGEIVVQTPSSTPSNVEGAAPVRDARELQQLRARVHRSVETDAVHESWLNRTHYLATLPRGQNELDEWVRDNEDLYGRPDVQLNMEVIRNFFLKKAEPTRVPARSGRNPIIPIGERIAKAKEDESYFNEEHFKHFLPHEGDDLRLFFTLLLENLPLHTFKQVLSSKGYYKMPTTTTLDGFFKEYSVRFKGWVGVAPSLWDWQRETQKFLTDWCALTGEKFSKNKCGFKWEHAKRRDGIWSLREPTCGRIAHRTTYQYALALLQSEAFKKPQ